MIRRGPRREATRRVRLRARSLAAGEVDAGGEPRRVNAPAAFASGPARTGQRTDASPNTAVPAAARGAPPRHARRGGRGERVGEQKGSDTQGSIKIPTHEVCTRTLVGLKLSARPTPNTSYQLLHPVQDSQCWPMIDALPLPLPEKAGIAFPAFRLSCSEKP